MNENTKKTIKLAMPYILIFISALVFNSCYGIVIVNGKSMVPTYHNNDVLIHEKIAYKFSKPKINDIITVDLPENILGKKEKIIKRVVAVGGDKIAIKDNVFYRNGKKVNEPYINEKMNTTDFANIDEYTLEDDEVFVMGDNRNHSTDSRYFGAVPMKYVKSKVIIYNKTFSNIMKSFYKFVGAM